MDNSFKQLLKQEEYGLLWPKIKEICTRKGLTFTGLEIVYSIPHKVAVTTVKAGKIVRTPIELFMNEDFELVHCSNQP